MNSCRIHPLARGLWRALVLTPCLAVSLIAGALQQPPGKDLIQRAWAAADRQVAIGQLTEAERTLRAAAAEATTDGERSATALRLGIVLTSLGRLDEARTELDRAASSDAVNRVALLSAKGGLLARSADFSGAEKFFTQAASLARASDSHLDEAREQLNALRARLDRQELAELDERLDAVYQLVWSLPASEDAADLLLGVGELHRRAINEFRASTALRARAYKALTRAREFAQTDATRAYGTGLLGALYLDEGRSEESLRLSSEAIFIAQSATRSDQLYRWEWQAERAQQRLGDPAAAESSIDRAVEDLDPIRNDVLRSSRQAYRTLIEPVYLDSADVKLQRAAHMAEGSDEQQHLLRQVRDRLESLKQAEVQDYFERACITSKSPSDTPPAFHGAAIIYPIILPDRLEVLIDANGILRRFVTPVGRGELTTAIRRARLSLERPKSGDEYLEPTQQLYRWILRDADQWLHQQGTQTLVFVPTGPLRTIPLGVLHDGRRFVIERYAVATTPAVSLLTGASSAPIKRVLVGGLSKSVQGFPGLPRVVDELHSVAAEYLAQPLQDESFRIASVEAGLSTPDFTAVHLATHGEFSADHRQSFVLTYDNRLTLDNLQDALGRRVDSPLDLLVLSACRTAAGDDRAALGLAGVAVQAGARSALASLWYVSDEASAVLMTDFYKRLKAGNASKAESLREAQRALLREPKYQHPGYWAPYLLIGNWT